MKHIKDYKKDGSQLKDLKEVLQGLNLTHDQVQKLLVELKKEGKVYSVGRTNAARWFPVEH